jgi:hypothetical protein
LKNILNIKAMRHLAALFAASAGFVAVLWLCGWLVRPDLQADLPSYSPEELAAAEKLRDNSVDPADDLQIYRAVDYSAGPQAAWYPKGESPILAELVAEGKLPPVQERVGAEHW